MGKKGKAKNWRRGHSEENKDEKGKDEEKVR